MVESALTGMDQRRPSLASLQSVLDVESRFQPLEILLHQPTCLAESERIESRRSSWRPQASPLQRLHSAIELLPERGRAARQTSQQRRHGRGIETRSPQELDRFDVGLFFRLGIVVLHQGANLIVSPTWSPWPAEVAEKNMRDLMRQHGRELGLVTHERDQSIGQDDIPIPCCKGAGCKIASDIESPSFAPSATRPRSKPLRQVLHVRRDRVSRGPKRPLAGDPSRRLGARLAHTMASAEGVSPNQQ